MGKPANSSIPRVFVVEDNPADARLVREGVDATEHPIDLEVINSGREAAERLTAMGADTLEHHPDLILLDLNLPGKSGFDLLETIRNGTAFPDVPVVVVSSSESPEDINRVYELSANAYVTKPADPDDYIGMIHATIDFWIATATRSPSND
ncbi:response regulator [Halohasta salina]|uniref:response regulator n=1 Tax=Halohasta salina TaxID=2961621 RepID=UPI0020A49A2B|nr:response regulator [Halohasta salina]